MDWPLLLGSLAGVLVLAGVAWALGLGGGRIDDEATARRHAEDALTGFDATAAVLAEDGRGALVLGADGSVALLKQHGVQIAARRLVPPLDARRIDGSIVIDSGERLFGRVTLPADDKLLTLL